MYRVVLEGDGMILDSATLRGSQRKVILKTRTVESSASRGRSVGLGGTEVSTRSRSSCSCSSGLRNGVGVNAQLIYWTM